MHYTKLLFFWQFLAVNCILLVGKIFLKFPSPALDTVSLENAYPLWMQGVCLCTNNFNCISHLYENTWYWLEVVIYSNYTGYLYSLILTRLGFNSLNSYDIMEIEQAVMTNTTINVSTFL